MFDLFQLYCVYLALVSKYDTFIIIVIIIFWKRLILLNVIR